MSVIDVQPLSQSEFEAFGDVIEIADVPSAIINKGMCERFSDLARIDVCGSGCVGISLFKGQHYAFPIALGLMERHPLGSQCFIPMSSDPYLVIVAADAGGKPGVPRLFITNGTQGVNYLRNTWHGVLTPIHRNALFCVVDYIGSGDNLEEYEFDEPYTIDSLNHSDAG